MTRATVGAPARSVVQAACFYHVYADGEWEAAMVQFLSALAVSDWRGPLGMGIVGTPGARARVKALIAHRGLGVTLSEAEKGWEQLTLSMVVAHAREHDGVVLYAHTKGAANPGRFQEIWRAEMTRLVIADWAMNVRTLQGDYDAVGAHWLTPGEYESRGVGAACFGGNFWAATCEFLRTLPPPRSDSRHEAEWWLGRGPALPRVLDRSPGWPGELV